MQFRPLPRLILAVALLYVWLVVFAFRTIKKGQRRLVDRSDRRDLSLFHMLERCLVNGQPISLRLAPYFT